MLVGFGQRRYRRFQAGTTVKRGISRSCVWGREHGENLCRVRAVGLADDETFRHLDDFDGREPFRVWD